MSDSEVAARISAQLNHEAVAQQLVDNQQLEKGTDMRRIGMGNFAGWGVTAAIIGAVLGAVVGRGIGAAIGGAVVFGSGLWLVSQGAKRSGAYHRDSRPLRWLAGGALAGGAVGSVIALTSAHPWFDAVRLWSTFLGGVAWLLCWIARGAARRDIDPEAIRQYNIEFDKKHGTDFMKRRGF